MASTPRPWVVHEGNADYILDANDRIIAKLIKNREEIGPLIVGAVNERDGLIQVLQAIRRDVRYWEDPETGEITTGASAIIATIDTALGGNG